MAKPATKITFVKSYDDPQGNVTSYEIELNGHYVGSLEKSSSWNGERYAADGYHVGVDSATEDGPDFAESFVVSYKLEARAALKAAKDAARAYIRANAAALLAAHGPVVCRVCGNPVPERYPLCDTCGALGLDLEEKN